MQDHSHRLLFLGATGLMCAAAIYASQAVPALLAPSDTTAATMPFETSSETQSAVSEVSFTPSPSASPTEENVANESEQQGSASVVPNNRSCPAADVAALVSPPSVNGAIGSPTPLENNTLPRQGLTGTALGTGSGCPPARDVSAPKIPTAADAPPRNAAAALPGAVSNP